MPEHVHLLVGCDPHFGMHRLVKLFTGYSAHALRAELPARSADCHRYGRTAKL